MMMMMMDMNEWSCLWFGRTFYVFYVLRFYVFFSLSLSLIIWKYENDDEVNSIWDVWDDFNEILTEMILLKRETVPTFGEVLDEYGVNLICVTYNYSKKKEVTVSGETHPDMKILDGLRMSCNLPFVFSHFQYDGDYYFDGFLSNNFPIHHISPEGRAIGITAEGNMCLDGNEALDFWKIVWNLFVTPIQELQSIKNAPYLSRCKVIELDMNKYSFLDYKLSSKNMLNMYSEGFSKIVSIFNLNL